MPFKHGKYRTPEFAVWQTMLRRCYESNHMNFKYYGARGIGVCYEWRNSFAAFLHDVGERPSPKHELDRINNDGDYEPGNVRWITHREQCQNRRTTRIYEYQGQRHCIKEWAALVGMKTGTVQWRLNHGWSIEDALSTQLRINQFG